MVEELDVTEVVRAVELVREGYRSSRWLVQDGHKRPAMPAGSGAWSKNPQLKSEAVARQPA